MSNTASARPAEVSYAKPGDLRDAVQAMGEWRRAPEKAAHLIIMTSGGGPYKVRPTRAVITFLGSRLRPRVRRASAAAVSSNG